MNPVKALTNLDAIDGLRIIVSLQPLRMLRLAGTWNYANIDKSGFSLCSALMRDTEDEENKSPYNDFLCGEFSSEKGIHVLGSYIPFPNWGIMAKVEGHMKD